MKRLIYIVPVIAFAALAAVLFYQLSQPQTPAELPSALIGKPVPQRDLAALDAKTQGFGPRDLGAYEISPACFQFDTVSCNGFESTQ